MAIYEYTLQPIAARITPDEFLAAQLELFSVTSKLKLQTWIIVAVVALIGLAGVIYFSGVSSVFFWLLLVGVLVFVLLRFVGMKWYVKRELNKQNIPPEVTQIKLGLQPHGLIISLPNSLAGEMLKGMDRSMMTMVRAKPMNGDVPWNNITDVKETQNFIMVTFKLKGQDGSQIIPKRLAAQNFPVERLRQHLKEAGKL